MLKVASEGGVKEAAVLEDKACTDLEAEVVHRDR